MSNTSVVDCRRVPLSHLFIYKVTMTSCITPNFLIRITFNKNKTIDSKGKSGGDGRKCKEWKWNKEKRNGVINYSTHVSSITVIGLSSKAFGIYK